MTDYKEKYDNIIKEIGYDYLKTKIPFTIKDLKIAYKTDKNLNNIPLKFWDNAGLFLSNNFSLAEKVCILKETAIKMIGEKND